MAVQLDVAFLPRGTKLRAPLYDDRNVKLLAAGITITNEILESLLRYGVTKVQVDDVDCARMSAFVPKGISKVPLPTPPDYPLPKPSRTVKGLAIKLQSEHKPELSRSDRPFLGALKEHGTEALDPEFGEYIADRHEDCIVQLRETLIACKTGDLSGLSQLTNFIRNQMDDVIEDFDAMMCLGINPSQSGYPIRHGCHSALLALGIATQLDQDEQQLNELLVGMMIHDWGMLKVRSHIVNSRTELSAEDFEDIARHPFYTLEMLSEAKSLLSPSSLLVALEVHERCNGRGYPFGKSRGETHYLSRIAAVADAYTAMVTPRPHRPGLMPYFAVEQILRGVRDGQFDAAVVRALLHAVAMFPVGSYVDLGDAFVGRVIRTKGADFDRPIVEVWKSSNLTSPPSVVDLSQTNRLKILRALPSLRA